MVDIKDLRKINFMKDLPEAVLEKVATVAQVESFDEETILIRQDQNQHLVYMLLSGAIYLNCRASRGHSLTLDELRAGQTFGLSSLLDNSPATYTAICAEDSRVITISSAQLLKLFSSDYAAGFEVMQRVVDLFKSRMNRHTQDFLHALSTHPDIGGLQEGVTPV